MTTDGNASVTLFYNRNHDARGRFATTSGGSEAPATFWSPGEFTMADKVRAARQLLRDAGKLRQKLTLPEDIALMDYSETFQGCHAINTALKTGRISTSEEQRQPTIESIHRLEDLFTRTPTNKAPLLLMRGVGGHGDESFGETGSLVGKTISSDAFTSTSMNLNYAAYAARTTTEIAGTRPDSSTLMVMYAQPGTVRALPLSDVLYMDRGAPPGLEVLLPPGNTMKVHTDMPNDSAAPSQGRVFDRIIVGEILPEDPTYKPRYSQKEGVAKLSNPNHDKRGRFASAGGSSSKGFDISRATNATEELELISGHISNSITPAEDDALLNYQSTMEQCQFMNAVLREGPDAFPKEMRDWQNVKQAMAAVPLMKAVMDRTPAMTRPIDVMRGITDPPESWGPVGSLTGKVLKDDGFISVTKDQVLADIFATKEGMNAGAVMQIAVPAGSKVLPLSGISYRELDVLGVSDTGYTHPVWEELILQPGTQFKVTGDRMGTGLYGKRELAVEAIPPAGVAQLSNPNHDKRGRFATSGGGSPAMKFSANPSDGLPLPPVPGTIAIPKGTVRLFHQTTEEQAIKIRSEGIEARQPTEGPWGVWGAPPVMDAQGNAKGFYGRADERATVEYAVPAKDLDKWGGPLQRSVTPAEVLAVHLPWHAKARFIMDSPSTLKAVLAGEFDSYKESEGGGIRETVQAIRWVKAKMAKKNLSAAPLDVSEFFNKNHDKRGRFASSGGSRVNIGGTMVRIKGRFSPSAATKARLSAKGQPTPDVYELDPSEAKVFRKGIMELKTSGNKHAASVHVYDEEEYRNMRTFLTDDGKTGFALHGDELVSAFSAGDTKYKGAVQSHLAVAVENGGRRLDAFDTVLPNIYAQAGFEPIARVKWDDNYAPEGWDYKLYAPFNNGRPDVVAMVYNPDAVGARYKPGAGAYAPDYDAMVNASTAEVQKRTAAGMYASKEG